jgi:L-histidine Nalpha-methyltransferase
MEPVFDISRVREDIRVDDHLDAHAATALADDVLDGLTRPFKELPPKWLYDDFGSELFDRICELPEYYPTRTERAILERCAGDVVATTRAQELLELGAGFATKTRVLLDTGAFTRYLPFDVSACTVRACAGELVQEYPGLAVHGIVGDYECHLDRVPAARGPRLAAFLGGTIGNFTPGARRRFLRSVAAELGADGHLLLGTDLVKDVAELEAAYDDAAGVTAAFNRNVLRVLNRELGADFDLDAFEHVAFFDTEHEWVDLRLRARSRQVVSLRALGLTVSFAAREELRTEISAKFTRSRLEADLAAAGLELVRWYTDADQRYALTLSRPAGGAP